MILASLALVPAASATSSSAPGAKIAALIHSAQPTFAAALTTTSPVTFPVGNGLAVIQTTLPWTRAPGAVDTKTTATALSFCHDAVADLAKLHIHADVSILASGKLMAAWSNKGTCRG